MNPRIERIEMLEVLVLYIYNIYIYIYIYVLYMVSSFEVMTGWNL